MRSIYHILLAAVITLTLAGCKTVLPNPATSDSTLVLAPFAADTAAKSSGAWMYEYVLNHDRTQTIRFNPLRVRGLFSVVSDLPEGEYTVTGLQSVANSKGRMRAIGEGEHYPFDKSEYVSFTVKSGEITVVPAIFTMKKVKENREVSYIYPDYSPLDDIEFEEFQAEVKKLEGYDSWVNQG